MLQCDDCLRIESAASYLGVCRNTLRNSEARGKIKVCRHVLNNQRLKVSNPGLLRKQTEPSATRLKRRPR